MLMADALYLDCQGYLCSDRGHYSPLLRFCDCVHTMSTPEWKREINRALGDSIKKDPDAVTYVLSTSNHAAKQSKVRFVQHRGFVNEKSGGEDPSKNPAEDEEQGLVGEALVMCTDCRYVAPGEPADGVAESRLQDPKRSSIFSPTRQSSSLGGFL